MRTRCYRWFVLLAAPLSGLSATASAQPVARVAAEIGLVAQYPFTGNAADASGNGFDGTVVGTTLTTDKDGNPNQAYAFNGTGARITLPNAAALKRFNQSFTVSARVRMVSSANTTHTIISNRINIPGNVGGSRFDIVDGAVGDRRMNFTVKGGVTAQTITGTSDVPYNTWSHVAITFDFTGSGTNTVRLYLNGVLDGTGAVGNILDPGAQPNTLGGEPNTAVAGIVHFAGSMDEVRIYSRALSQSEVASLVASDAPLPVELQSLTATARSGRIELSWQTASERDNAGFAVLRNDVEVADFRTNAALRGNGTTAQPSRYAYTDATVVPGRTYSYRLQSTDLTGEIHDYPQTVEVTAATETTPTTAPTEFALHPASPNPFNPTTTIRFDLPEAATVSVQVFNSLGQMVAAPALNQSFSAGAASAVTLDGAGLSSGVYLVRMTAVGGSGHVYRQAQRVLLAK